MMKKITGLILIAFLAILSPMSVLANAPDETTYIANPETVQESTFTDDDSMIESESDLKDITDDTQNNAETESDSSSKTSTDIENSITESDADIENNADEEEPDIENSADEEEPDIENAPDPSEWIYTENNGQITIKGFKRSVTTLSVPASINGKPVTQIASGAFKDDTTLETLNLYSSVLEINKEAFSGCSYLRTVNVSGYIKKIHERAFSDCPSLTDASINNLLKYGIEEIRASAFANCTSITYVRFPRTLKTLQMYSDSSTNGIFTGCTNLRKISFTNLTANINYDPLIGLPKSSVVIEGFKDSTAQAYANRYGRTFSSYKGSANATLSISTDNVEIVRPNGYANIQYSIASGSNPDVALDVSWIVSDSNIISISSNNLDQLDIHAKKAGTADILGTTTTGKHVKIHVTVYGEILSFSIKGGTDHTVLLGENYQLIPEIQMVDPDAPAPTIRWHSVQSDLLSVDQNGVVCGKDIAQVTLQITATSGVFSKYYTCTIKIIDPVEAFVGRLYQEILGRAGDAQGINSWYYVLKSGKEQGAKVAQGFIESPEFKARNLSDDDYIKALYRTFLNREADASGLASWKNVLNSGLSRMHVFKGFAESPEFTEICARYGIIRGYTNLTAPMDQNEGVTKFIVRNYRLCLGREADEAGLNAWCSQILTGKNTAKEAAAGFVFSTEFINKNLSDTEYVKTLYRVFMDREADTAGLNAWVNVLRKGQSREHVFNGFADSQEFKQICASYGIK